MWPIETQNAKTKLNAAPCPKSLVIDYYKFVHFVAGQVIRRAYACVYRKC